MSIYLNYQIGVRRDAFIRINVCILLFDSATKIVVIALLENISKNFIFNIVLTTLGRLFSGILLTIALRK